MADGGDEIALVDAVEVFLFDEDLRLGEGAEIDLVERLIDRVGDEQLFGGGAGGVGLPGAVARRQANRRSAQQQSLQGVPGAHGGRDLPKRRASGAGGTRGDREDLEARPGWSNPLRGVHPKGDTERIAREGAE